MVATTKRILAVLAFPTRPRDAIVRCDAISVAYEANETTLLAGCTPPRAALIALTNDLKTAEADAEAKVRGAAAVRNAKYKACHVGYSQFTASVQARMDANPEMALQIAQAALLNDRKSGKRQKNQFGAAPAPHSGVVALTAPAGAKKVQTTQFWQISADGGKTWTDIQPSHKSKITVSGLTPGSTVMFRHRFLAKEVLSDWSQTLTVLVH